MFKVENNFSVLCFKPHQYSKLNLNYSQFKLWQILLYISICWLNAVLWTVTNMQLCFPFDKGIQSVGILAVYLPFRYAWASFSLWLKGNLGVDQRRPVEIFRGNLFWSYLMCGKCPTDLVSRCQAVILNMPMSHAPGDRIRQSTRRFFFSPLSPVSHCNCCSYFSAPAVEGRLKNNYRPSLSSASGAQTSQYSNPFSIPLSKETLYFCIISVISILYFSAVCVIIAECVVTQYLPLQVALSQWFLPLPCRNAVDDNRLFELQWIPVASETHWVPALPSQPLIWLTTNAQSQDSLRMALCICKTRGLMCCFVWNNLAVFTLTLISSVCAPLKRKCALLKISTPFVTTCPCVAVS